MSEIKVNSIKGVAASAAAISVDNSNGTCTLASGSKLNNCTTDGTTNLTVADGNLVPILVKAVQELSAKVEELETKLNNKES